MLGREGADLAKGRQVAICAAVSHTLVQVFAHVTCEVSKNCNRISMPTKVLGWPKGWVGLMELQFTLRLRWICPSCSMTTFREVGASP